MAGATTHCSLQLPSIPCGLCQPVAYTQARRGAAATVSIRQYLCSKTMFLDVRSPCTAPPFATAPSKTCGGGEQGKEKVRARACVCV